MPERCGARSASATTASAEPVPIRATPGATFSRRRIAHRLEAPFGNVEAANRRERHLGRARGFQRVGGFRRRVLEILHARALRVTRLHPLDDAVEREFH